MSPLIIAFVIGWFLTPLAIDLFWLFIAVMPFVAIYDGESANLVLILFCLSALLIQNEFRFLYVIGAVATIIFMLLSAVVASAFAYVTSHPADVAITIAAGMMAFIVFLQRKPPDAVNERQRRHDNTQFATSYDPHFGFAKGWSRLIEPKVVAPRPAHPSPRLRTRRFSVVARLRRRFSRPLQAGDLVVCVMPCGELVAGLYTVRSRENGFVSVWEIGGGWEVRRFKRWTN